MAQQPQERLDRINELAKKDKEFGLTAAEVAERKALREAYLADFRAGFRQQLETTAFYNKAGKEITPEKLQAIQRKRGLRKD
ncbi:DUF896 domain-containing protein [Lacticaseibacillus parakribbianus]|uniref:DUF896 domain-containing protein n=1 Tax=Lacticaseibacillus parakribbianus TaxID=2970927 RepID=UPI0021CB04AE|nr:DUF896 domain-containing protein [Lacticaseibacillus parakribbianus]